MDVTFNNQSECLISAYHSYAMQNFVYDINYLPWLDKLGLGDHCTKMFFGHFKQTIQFYNKSM